MKSSMLDLCGESRHGCPAERVDDELTVRHQPADYVAAEYVDDHVQVLVAALPQFVVFRRGLDTL